MFLNLLEAPDGRVGAGSGTLRVIRARLFVHAKELGQREDDAASSRDTLNYRDGVCSSYVC